MMIEGAVDEIDSEDAERFLLVGRVSVEEVQVDENVGRILAWPGLEANAEPAVAVLRSRIAAGGDRVREDEERALRASPSAEPVDERGVLSLEHGLKALAADVAVGRSVDGVAHGR